MAHCFAPDETPQRVEALEGHFIENQYMVYDAAGDRVHYLNASAALIFELCDGNRPVTAIIDLVRRAYHLAESPADAVTSCLADLSAVGVIR